MAAGTLIAHAGGHMVQPGSPEMMVRHDPITGSHNTQSHQSVVDLVKKHIGNHGQYQVSSEEYAISHEGKRLFGVINIRDNFNDRDDYELAVALRHANDYAFSFQLGCASHVFVCDNMAFLAGDDTVRHRHTRYMMENMDKEIAGLMNRTLGQVETLHLRYDAYKDWMLTSEWADHILIEAVRRGALQKTKILDVDQEWKKPRHEEFEARNAWSLFNGFTEVNKGSNPMDQAKRTGILHNLFDEVVDYRPEREQMALPLAA